jgi:Icc-related predicted phosphoesterase
MKILAVSDKEVPNIYGSQIRNRFGDVEMVLGCGDLSYSYMEYIATMLSVPCFFVHGNHDRPVHLSNGRTLREPGGWVNLDGHTVRAKGLILAGLEGSMRYLPGKPYQYSEQEMAFKVWRLALPLLVHRLLDGRYLDILVTHSAPFGIHDGEDLCHQGFHSFLRLLRHFRPRYLFHGHHHTYGLATQQTQYLDTTVINVYPFHVIEIETQAP